MYVMTNHDQKPAQIALAIRDEVVDLEKAGIKIIQIDDRYRRITVAQRRMGNVFRLAKSV
jgi:methionine synthase II (cobalamin-independent)